MILISKELVELESFIVYMTSKYTLVELYSIERLYEDEILQKISDILLNSEDVYVLVIINF